MTISELRNKLRRLDLKQAVPAAIEATQEQYLNRQREQFAAGERSDESSLGGYTAAYAAIRRREGLQTEYKDLRRTGEFYARMLVEAYPDVVSITSDVDYEKWIDHHYNQGGKLYGLNPENLNAYRLTEFWPALKREIIAQTQLNFR